MSCYYRLACDKCREWVDSCRRGGTISPMAGAEDLIWHFLYTHADHPLRNLHESSEDDAGYKEWTTNNLSAMSAWLERPRGTDGGND